MLEDLPDYPKLSVRTRRRLVAHGIRTLKELRAITTRELLEIPGFGAKCLREVIEFLEPAGVDEAGRPAWSANGSTNMPTAGWSRLGFENLTDLTRECLEEAGITNEEGVGKCTLDEILRALMYDQESVDELWQCCVIPRPSGVEEALGLLSTSEVARQRLAMCLRDEERAYRDLLAGCADLVREQIGERRLHPLALMNFMPLQSVNGLLKPPAKNLEELLTVAEHGAIVLSGATLEKVESALGVRFLGQELQELLGVLDDRELHVLRGRYAPVQQTLEAVGQGLGVTRERVRQIQITAKRKLDETYRIELPLPRLRSAMLTISGEGVSSIERMRDTLLTRGMIGEDENLDDFLAVWNALEGEGTNVADHHHQWRVIGREAYRFPEDIGLVLKTGQTSGQQEIAKTVMPLVRKRCSRSGYFSLAEVLGAAYGEEPPEVGEVARVLQGHGCSRVDESHWIGPADGYTVLHAVARKMLDNCGPLDLSALRRGMVRHQKRHRVAAPPPHVVEALLKKRDDIVLKEDGRFASTAGAWQHHPLGRQELTWLGLVRKHGPVVTFGQISRAFDEAGLSRASAAVLAGESDLVVRCAPNRYCLPGREREAMGTLNAAAPSDGPPRYGMSEQGIELGVARARLVMDLNGSPAMRLHVPETRWTGEADVSFAWNGEEWPVQTRYLADDDTTIAGPRVITIAGPEWDDLALLSGPDSFMSVNVPAPPTKRSLVFLASDGRQVKNWREGQEHLVLMARGFFDKNLASLLFERHEILDGPDGWEDHVLVRAELRSTPPTGVRRPAGAGREVGTQRALEDAAHAMGLPSVKLLHRVRSRLLGAQIPERDRDASTEASANASRFAVSRRPYLEISGLSDGPLRVALYRIEPGGRGWREERVGGVQLPAGWRARILDLWDGQPSPGLYRIRTDGCEDLLLELVREPAPRDRAMDVRLSSSGDATTGDETFVVRAWPMARLWLTATSGALWRRYLPLEIGESGRWQGDLADLGIIDVPSEGDLVVSVSWRNLVERELSLRQKRRRSAGSRFAWSEVRSERVLALRDSNGHGGFAVPEGETFVLGERPWLGEIWEPVVRRLPGGVLAAVVPDAVNPAWAVELPDTDREDARITAVDNGARRVREPRFGLGDLLGRSKEVSAAENWREVSGTLRKKPLPPALRRKLGVEELRGILEGSVVGFPSRPRWSRLDRSLLAELEQWSRYGLALPVAAFAYGAGPENEAGAVGGIAALTVDASRLCLEGESPLFNREKDGRTLKTNTTVHRLRGSDTYHLSVGQTLTVCLGCGLYLLPEKFNYHEPVIDGRAPCRSLRSAYRTVSSGSRAEAELWVYRDPALYLRACGEMVRRVGEGDDDVPEAAEPWIDQVVEAFNDEAQDGEEPGAWFARASDLLMDLKQLMERLERYSERETLLADRGWLSRPYRRGVDVASRWVQSKVGRP